MERVFLIWTLVIRPMVIVFHLKDYEVDEFDEFMSNSTTICNDRLTILTYVSNKSSFFFDNYPINILRNIGIYHTITTHFILFDIDMWPSCSFL